MKPTRRALLGASTAGFASLAGCSVLRGLLGDGGSRSDTPSRTTVESTPTSTETGPGTERNGNSLDYPRRVVVRNDTDAEEFVTVAVSEGDEVVYGKTRLVPPDGEGRFEDVVQTAGTFDVAVETESGRVGTREWPVSSALGDLLVQITTKRVDFRQTAFCTPACEPLSLGGSTEPLPYYGMAMDNPLYYGAAFTLANRSGARQRVSLRVERDGESIIDYGYAVPAGMVLTFPGFHVADVFDVIVTTETASKTHAWHVTKERYLTITLEDDDISIGCGGSTADIRLSNYHDTTHEVTVRARPVGSSRDDPETVLFSEAYTVGAGTTQRHEDVFEGSGHYLLDVALRTGTTTTYDWWLCPPRGPTQIRISDAGELSVIQLIPAE